VTASGRGRPPRDDSGRDVRAYGVTGRPIDPRRRPTRSSGKSGVWRGVIFLVILAAVVLVGAFLFAGPALRDFARGTARDNPQSLRIPFVADVVRDDLGGALESPADADATPTEFIVQSGATVTAIARALADQGLISDPAVFQYIVITRDLESQLQSGTFTLSAQMTPQEIVDRLRQAPEPAPAMVTLALRDGLRVEQYVAQLEDQQPAQVDPAEFYELAQRPPAELVSDYPWLEAIPAGQSLEGFLGAGVFEFDAETDAQALLRLLLDEWQATNEAFVTRAEQEDRDLYEVVTLASIVEREAVLDEERALIAGVYQNRLDGLANGVLLLNADPTVIYANDTMQLRDMGISEWPQFVFWNRVGEALQDFAVTDDLQGYQSYQTGGLPPGPIASPSNLSIEAAFDPDTADGYLFFVATCDGSRGHLFATNNREHNENVAQCQ